ncbi:hypothetical protein AEYBE204_01020 [Asticcacaulis sp. YBE204]|nr:hypothetical protein AEYBE204_01020 [Asticcacaulis sp. YBE204]
MDWSQSEIAALIGTSLIFGFGLLKLRYPDHFNSIVMRNAPRGLRLFFFWFYAIFAGAIWSVFVFNLVVMRVWFHFLK